MSGMEQVHQQAVGIAMLTDVRLAAMIRDGRVVPASVAAVDPTAVGRRLYATRQPVSPRSHGPSRRWPTKRLRTDVKGERRARNRMARRARRANR